MTLDLFVTLVSAVIVGAYMWSVRGHFASEGMPRGALVIALIVTANTIVLLALTWLLPQPAWAQILGIAIEIASGLLFVWAIMSSRKARLKFVFDPEHPHGLVESGPYRFVRHPFYVSYIVFWTGWSIATWSAWSLIGLVVVIALYVRAARMEENNFAATPMSGEYASYRQRVGFFWPRLR
ncbi:hypothetical protein GCM10007989_08550 [Devosia pacifica]|uniref:Protein-S-isoprenylcysteine O-methyltransferase Ste14 n=1 Tax=Devosia pacifica TaxID=1335967 RepID=A0A918RY83_9HYPH|nr:isoprenylcysteine carboxylmethyltransferase family protein [Devosia pacifica]GHA15929.1 hypothetical protein GCM10007989_08550 [Devosia pacifica]